jgi:hypothetical protein
MSYTPVEKADLEFEPNGIRHKPTGAFFSVDPGQIYPKSVNWGRAGDLLENSDDYDRNEIQKVAMELLRKRGPQPARKFANRTAGRCGQKKSR